jgi:imidazolonepropionase-like amidohydrolase
MTRKIFGLALLFLGCNAGFPQAAASGSKVTLLKASRMLDVRTGKYVENAGILIENDRIKEAGPISAVQAHAGKDATIIDLGAATLLPGLIDCHAHLLTSGTTLFPQETILNAAAGMSPTARVLLGAHNAREDLEGGFTTVRVVGHSGMTAMCHSGMPLIAAGCRGRVSRPRRASWLLRGDRHCT